MLTTAIASQPDAAEAISIYEMVGRSMITVQKSDG
jgi:hypothetical protein